MKDYIVKADIYRVFSHIFSYPEDKKSLEDFIGEVGKYYPRIKSIIPIYEDLNYSYIPFMKGEIPLSCGSYIPLGTLNILKTYKAFGVKPKSGDNPDSLPYILQFMSLLCLKIALAPDEEKREITLNAYKTLLKEYMEPFTDKLLKRVREKLGDGFYKNATEALVVFIKEEVKNVNSDNTNGF